jgi:NAD(P)-dependent dehydrogenase (short-subunit alcohol dehydrogenase family)
LQAGCSKVYITSRKKDACDEAVAALNALPNKRPGAQAISVPADSSRMEELDRLVAEIAKTTDHVDILFANAGATWGEKFDTHPEKMFSKVMDLNVKSIFYTIQKYVSKTIATQYLKSLSLTFIQTCAPSHRQGHHRRAFSSHRHCFRCWYRYRCNW